MFYPYLKSSGPYQEVSVIFCLVRMVWQKQFFCVEFSPSIIFLFLLVINFIRNYLKNIIKDEML